ncbi:zinc ribbon domain-containing protein [Dictyobacter formicarum]|uniref:DZANK-type domain-containing protein n=1 Tax=Dictyobacter formicarum TaxID=2778368 RepID=A0ABQ3VD91_9CHLR|nr:zinc ribbon domain-containing protein [Dictyobacter formicarum]GHO83676.1 hypothetical protein KSZ_16820 [Dictyobacter formicarum]
MTQAPYIIEATITLASISLIYIALFFCGLVVFLLSLIILQWARSKQCSVCLKRLRRSDNYCHYCGTATHPIVTSGRQGTYVPQTMPWQAPPSTSNYRPATAWPAASNPGVIETPLQSPMLAATPVRYTDSYHTTSDEPDYLCPTCNGPLHLSDTFCGNCGGRLVPTVNQIRQHS